MRKARERMSYDDIRALQLERLRSLVRHAVANSPFYRRLYSGIDLENFDITDLPPISKADLMENFDELLCVRDLTLRELEEFVSDESRAGELYKDKYVVSHSSGTTGRPGIFVMNEEEWLEQAALTAAKPGPIQLDWAQLFLLPIRPFFRYRFTALIATKGHLASHIAYLAAPKVKVLFVITQEIDILSPLDEIIDKLNKFKPHFMHSYPTLLRELALKKLDGVLNINPRLINVSSEYFAPSTEELCLKAFPNVIIDEVYGATECMSMGRRCVEGKIHMTCEAAIVEPVDENDNPVGFGEVSHHILLTNLFNYTQPLIRYRISDTITVWPPDRCTCGAPLPVVEVVGRTNDVLRLPKRGGGEVTVLPVHAYIGVHGIEEVERFQIIHEEPRLVVVRFMCKDGADADEIRQKIERKLTDVLSELEADVVVRAELSEVERDPVSGKFKQVIERAGAKEGG